jgi:hypothetical protein
MIRPPDADDKRFCEDLMAREPANGGSKKNGNSANLGFEAEYFLGQFAGSEGKAGRRVLYAEVGRTRHGRNAGASESERLTAVIREQLASLLPG